MTNRSERTITVPEHVWGRLASEAANRRISIADLLVLAIKHAIQPPNVRAERVLLLAQAGRTNREICEITGETRSYVQGVLANAGQKSNRESGQRKKAS